ncbi:hypothetical protein SMC26_32780 [Actinomadura fulvescens]|uniref:Endonuclease/exonuclease/phosphatase domain-containing protein n=1 Tax=Actinomadura fulvescens TaxID=46160 RepID=A0ABN3R180_9ACTN
MGTRSIALTFLTGLLVVTTPGIAAAHSTPAARQTAPADNGASALGRDRRVLQMNICNSGYASCYRGGVAVTSAIKMIRRRKPWVVTLNEACGRDAQNIAKAIGMRYTFFPAHKASGGAARCKNKQAYGNAVLTWQNAPRTYYRVLARQVRGAEKRSMGCREIQAMVACTTHLTNKSKSVALDQCKEAIVYARKFARGKRVFLIGDLNLRYNKDRVQSCVPKKFTRKSDGSVQHAIVDNRLPIKGHNHEDLWGSDHDAFWVDLGT